MSRRISDAAGLLSSQFSGGADGSCPDASSCCGKPVPGEPEVVTDSESDSEPLSASRKALGGRRSFLNRNPPTTPTNAIDRMPLNVKDVMQAELDAQKSVPFGG